MPGSMRMHSVVPDPKSRHRDGKGRDNTWARADRSAQRGQQQVHLNDRRVEFGGGLSRTVQGTEIT